MAYITHYQGEGDRRRNTTLPEGATDALLIDMWLRSHRSQKTRDAYQRDLEDLRTFADEKPLQQITLLDSMDFEVHLTQEGLRSSSIARKLSACKSLLTFCQKAGYTAVNVGVALKLPAIETRLAERIMSKHQVLTMLV